jgi:hypothetical protein
MQYRFPKIFSHSGFLLYAGMLLLAVGALGYAYILGPTKEYSIFGEVWWFDNRENLAHLVIGIILLGTYSLSRHTLVKRLVLLALGTLAAFAALYNLQQTKILGAQLQSPLDTLFHILISVWAFVAVYHPQNTHHNHTSA